MGYALLLERKERLSAGLRPAPKSTWSKVRSQEKPAAAGHLLIAYLVLPAQTFLRFLHIADSWSRLSVSQGSSLRGEAANFSLHRLDCSLSTFILADGNLETAICLRHCFDFSLLSCGGFRSIFFNGINVQQWGFSHCGTLIRWKIRAAIFLFSREHVQIVYRQL